jgi:hypothetical protein
MSVFKVEYKGETGQVLLSLTVKASNSDEAENRVIREFNLPVAFLSTEILPGVDNREADLL